jgi:hypothetical protein
MVPRAVSGARSVIAITVATTNLGPNHWTVFCRFLGSDIHLGISLVPVTQAWFSPTAPHPAVGLPGETSCASLPCQRLTIYSVEFQRVFVAQRMVRPPRIVKPEVFFQSLLQFLRAAITFQIHGVRPAKNLLCTSVSLVVFRNHEEIRQCGASEV